MIFRAAQEQYKKRGRESLSAFYLPLYCGGGALRHDQLSDGGDSELVLVCRRRLSVCLADRGCGLHETAESS